MLLNFKEIKVVPFHISNKFNSLSRVAYKRQRVGCRKNIGLKLIELNLTESKYININFSLNFTGNKNYNNGDIILILFLCL